MDAHQDRLAMFRPRTAVVSRSTEAAATLVPPTTAETPESTLTELMELMLPEDVNNANTAEDIDEEGKY